ncbi:MAG: DegT/DnrJ/EryC1/StrS family aminotransferase [Pirellulales bacterium]|nr:DegT/DnrJ/EryC1/StrS family aminotransferase [Pirellulales bacterium]
MVPFQNLQPLAERLAPQMAAAAARVLASGWYVLGPEVEAFEREWGDYIAQGAAELVTSATNSNGNGVAHALAGQSTPQTWHAIGVANGTDAIELALRAAGIGLGDEVITVAHTAVATICGIERSGARVVLVDIDPRTYAIDPAAAEAAITQRTRAIVPVHLYGHPSDMTAIGRLAERHKLLVVEDCAQAHGARWNGRLAGTFGHVATFSFYPTKNLAACGDAGAVVTRDADLAARVRRLRSYGQTSRDSAAERGTNSRLDELQAALLRVRLAYLDEHNRQRRELAAAYRAELSEVELPFVHPLAEHVYHLFVVRHAERDALRARLARDGVGTLVHYPVPVHLQPAYRDLTVGVGSLPETERAAAEVLSLPLWIGLERRQIEEVARAVRGATPEVCR